MILKLFLIFSRIYPFLIASEVIFENFTYMQNELIRLKSPLYDPYLPHYLPEEVLISIQILNFEEILEIIDLHVFQASVALGLMWPDTYLDNPKVNYQMPIMIGDDICPQFFVNSETTLDIWLPLLFSENIINYTSSDENAYVRYCFDNTYDVLYRMMGEMQFECLSNSSSYPYDKIFCRIQLSLHETAFFRIIRGYFRKNVDKKGNFYLTKEGVVFGSWENDVLCETILEKTTCIHLQFCLRRNVYLFNYIYYTPPFIFMLTSYGTLFSSPTSSLLRIVINSIIIVVAICYLYYIHYLPTESFWSPPEIWLNYTILYCLLILILNSIQLKLLSYYLYYLHNPIPSEKYKSYLFGLPVFSRWMMFKLCAFYSISPSDILSDLIFRFITFFILFLSPLYFWFTVIKPIKNEREELCGEIIDFTE